MIIRISDFMPELESLSEEAYLKRFPVPALLLAIPYLAKSEDSRISLADTVGGTGSRRLNPGEESKQAANYIAWLFKKHEDGGSIVTLGRAANNDVFILAPTVSKVHATFMAFTRRWLISDRGALNGLWLNGRRLEKNETKDVEDGDLLRFGEVVEARFLLPQSLYQSLSEA